MLHYIHNKRAFTTGGYMNITSEEIAKLANVSRSTVSRVINHYPNVPEETRIRVMDTTNARTIIWHQFCFLLFFKLLKVLLDTELGVS